MSLHDGDTPARKHAAAALTLAATLSPAPIVWSLFLQDARLVAALESLPRLGSLVLAACADITDRSLQVCHRATIKQGYCIDSLAERAFAAAQRHRAGRSLGLLHPAGRPLSWGRRLLQQAQGTGSSWASHMAASLRWC